VAGNGRLTELIEAAFVDRSVAEIVASLDAVGIANAHMRTVAEFADHPQHAARDRLRLIDSPVGPLRALLPPVTVAGREAAMGSIPAVGQHTAAILAELGLADIPVRGRPDESGSDSGG
jgi:itaconate CoA-transferase